MLLLYKFINYMKISCKLHIFKQVKEEKWLMPRIGQKCKIDYGIGRVTFAEEIADFLNPMREGISVGMDSTYNAAWAIESCFDSQANVKASYEASTRELKGCMKRKWDLVGGMAETFKNRRLYEWQKLSTLYNELVRLYCENLKDFNCYIVCPHFYTLVENELFYYVNFIIKVNVSFSAK